MGGISGTYHMDKLSDYRYMSQSDRSTLHLSKEQLLLPNQCVDKYPRKFATKSRRLLMSLSPESNVVRFPTQCVLMSKSESVRSPRELYRKLFPEDSVEPRLGRGARQLKTPGNNVAPCRMSSATTSQS